MSGLGFKKRTRRVRKSTTGAREAVLPSAPALASNGVSVQLTSTAKGIDEFRSPCGAFVNIKKADSEHQGRAHITHYVLYWATKFEDGTVRKMEGDKALIHEIPRTGEDIVYEIPEMEVPVNATHVAVHTQNPAGQMEQGVYANIQEDAATHLGRYKSILDYTRRGVEDTGTDWTGVIIHSRAFHVPQPRKASVASLGTPTVRKTSFAPSKLDTLVEGGMPAEPELEEEATGPSDEEREQFKTAVLTEDVETISTMLDAKYPIDAQDPNGETALYQASAEGKKLSVGLLLENYANVDIGSKDHLPVHIAIKNQHLDVVELLIGVGNSTVSAPVNGHTPLHLACSLRNNDITGFLCNTKGVDINAEDDQGNTPLHVATIVMAEDCVQTLLDAQANREAKNNADQTPFDLANKDSNENIYVALGGEVAKGKSYISNADVIASSSA